MVPKFLVSPFLVPGGALSRLAHKGSRGKTAALVLLDKTALQRPDRIHPPLAFGRRRVEPLDARIRECLDGALQRLAALVILVSNLPP